MCRSVANIGSCRSRSRFSDVHSQNVLQEPVQFPQLHPGPESMGQCQGRMKYKTRCHESRLGSWLKRGTREWERSTLWQRYRRKLGMYYWVQDIEWKTNGSIGLFVAISLCRTRVSIKENCSYWDMKHGTDLGLLLLLLTPLLGYTSKS